MSRLKPQLVSLLKPLFIVWILCLLYRHLFSKLFVTSRHVEVFSMHSLSARYSSLLDRCQCIVVSILEYIVLCRCASYSTGLTLDFIGGIPCDVDSRTSTRRRDNMTTDVFYLYTMMSLWRLIRPTTGQVQQ